MGMSERYQHKCERLHESGEGGLVEIRPEDLGPGEEENRWTEPNEQAAKPDAQSGRSTIRVGDNLDLAVQAAERALAEHAPGEFFQRGRVLVHVSRDGGRKLRNILRPPGAPVIIPVSQAHLRVVASRVAKWETPRSSGKGGWKTALPPLPVMGGLLDRGEWDLPYLEGVIEAPTIRPDGSILSKPGYDETTGLLYIPGGIKVPSIATAPTIDDAMRAYDEIAKYFTDFNFVAPSDESACVASVLTGVGRHSIDGPTPCFAWTSPVRGSGKTLGATTAAGIGTGRPPTILAPPVSREETQKLLVTLAIEGTQVVLFDNIVGSFGNGELSAAITARGDYGGRALGSNRTITAPLRPTWMLTGNNVVFRHDFGRRVIPIRIDPKCEFPEDRQGFRFSLPGDALKNRGNLVGAALTILRAHSVAGWNTHGGARVGGFELWDDRIRSSLIWLGKADPFEGQRKLRHSGDTDIEEIRDFLETWLAVFGDAGSTIKAAVARTQGSGDAPVDMDLRQTLEAIDANLRTRTIAARVKQWKGRIVRGLRLVEAGDDGHRSVVWKVEVVE